MRVEVFRAVRAKLCLDPVLVSYIGEGRVFRAKSGIGISLPAVTLQENSESSMPDVSYCRFRTRTNDPVLQADIWVNGNAEESPRTGEALELIANRVDEVLLDAENPVSGTRMWRRITSSQQFEEDTKFWHAALRYSFQYRLTDTK